MAICFSILPCVFIHWQLVAVAIKQSPTSRTNPAIMLTNGSNFLLIDSRCNAAGILPPRLDRLHDQQSTVICVTRIIIGEASAPDRFCEWYITMRPDPVSFMTYKRRFQKWKFDFNPFLPITVEQLSYLSQANGTWILIYAVQVFTDCMLGVLWSSKGRIRPQGLWILGGKIQTTEAKFYVPIKAGLECNSCYSLPSKRLRSGDLKNSNCVLLLYISESFMPVALIKMNRISRYTR